ncbi:MAG: thiol:disulfide interchange protein DsbD [Alteromonadaceae bacterium]|jgi:thiol:disulfide interchange protein DsbD
MNKFVSVFLLLLTIVVANFSLVDNTANAQQSIFDTSSSVLFDNDNDFLTVDEAFSFDFHQKNDQLEITFHIADGYYLYRKQFKITGERVTINAVNLPRGEDHEDEFFGLQEIYTGELFFTIDTSKASENFTVKIRYQGCAKKGLCYPPTSKVIALNKISSATDQQLILSALNTNSDDSANAESSQFINGKTPTAASEQNQLADMLKQDSLLLTLLAFFAGGLLLSFTPCVFPMYPILTGIIVGQAKDKVLTTKHAFTLSFFYVQGMAITYTLLGIVVALAGAQFQAMFQHPLVLIALSVLFIFLALSMFGFFNLALPTTWQNRLNNLSNQQKGGSIVGVVMMGVISGLVASPCTTAPLTGALLYISQTGDVVLGASALYALSLGMGLPLLILGSSGGKLLPKAGAWMNIIKNIFGLLLLAVPIFLLERIIPTFFIEILWVLLILATASYFYVANQNASEQKTKGFWYGFRSLLIFLMLFIGAQQAYQLIIPTALPNSLPITIEHQSSFKKIADLEELNQAIKEANGQGRTVMVDLYADWCIACKEFEEHTFSKPEVKQALANTTWLQIDLTETSSTGSIELMEHFDVFGLPSIIFFDLTGNELTQNRVTGFMKAEAFAKHIRAIF